ncbi:MAG TPA: hypothetical protein VF648_19390 [Pyrinomonadaceae bacterium]|jgi:hypothetical protein
MVHNPVQNTTKNVNEQETLEANQTKPNYILLGLGIAIGLLLLILSVVTAVVLPIVYQALFIAVSLTLILYGLYPVPRMRAKFGNLAVVGPAALGLFVFLFVWKSLYIAERKFILLQNAADQSLSRVNLPDGSALTLLEVDSLADDKLASILNSLKTTIDISHPKDSADAERYFEDFYKRLIKHMEFGNKETKAIEIFRSYKSGNVADKEVDAQWAELVKQVAQGTGNSENYIKKIKREPFALIRVEAAGKTNLDLVLPGEQLTVNGREYPVPVIANPALSVTKKIYEAIVIQTF